jgi:23S rRNA G2445 N2-methylase RlmL
MSPRIAHYSATISALNLRQARQSLSLGNNVNGIGLDIDKAVVVQAKKNIESWGLADQFKIHHENISSYSEKAGPFDLISLINILYYF